VNSYHTVLKDLPDLEPLEVLWRAVYIQVRINAEDPRPSKARMLAERAVVAERVQHLINKHNAGAY
jgi:hypothetical protein